MRRGERAIESKDGQKAILEHCRVCSLAFSGDEYPYVIPLNYGFVWNEDQETPVLYFHGAPVGTKIEHMERDNRVAFCVQNEKEIKFWNRHAEARCSMRVSAALDGYPVWLILGRKERH